MRSSFGWARNQRHAETKSIRQLRSGSKEIWVMDYDGRTARGDAPGRDFISPRISPDNARIAFASLGSNGWSSGCTRWS